MDGGPAGTWPQLRALGFTFVRANNGACNEKGN